MLGRSVTFRPESIEKRSQRGTLKNLTTPSDQTSDIACYVGHLEVQTGPPYFPWIDVEGPWRAPCHQLKKPFKGLRQAELCKRPFLKTSCKLLLYDVQSGLVHSRDSQSRVQLEQLWGWLSWEQVCLRRLGVSDCDPPSKTFFERKPLTNWQSTDSPPFPIICQLFEFFLKSMQHWIQRLI